MDICTRNNNHAGNEYVCVLEMLNDYCMSYQAILDRIKNVIDMIENKDRYTFEEVHNAIKSILEDFK